MTQPQRDSNDSLFEAVSLTSSGLGVLMFSACVTLGPGQLRQLLSQTYIAVSLRLRHLSLQVCITNALKEQYQMVRLRSSILVQIGSRLAPFWSWFENIFTL